MIKVNCPHCGIRLTAQDDLIGKPVNCQKCSTKFVLSKRWMNAPLSDPSGPIALADEADVEPIEGDNLERRQDAPSSNLNSKIFDLAELSNATSGINNSSIEAANRQPSLGSGSNPSNEVDSNSPPSANDWKTPAPRDPVPGFGNSERTFTADIFNRFSSSRNDRTSFGGQGELPHRSSTPLGSYRETYSLAALFDFRFRYFLTPVMIRVSWLLLVIVATMWVLLISYLYLSAILQRSESVIPPLLTNLAADLPQGTSKGSLPIFFFQTTLYFSWVFGTVLLLIWLRIALETIMMIFSIGSQLRERKSRNGER